MLIAAIAAAVRFVHTASIAGTPFARLLVGDGKGYDRWAAAIVAGDWIGHETFYQAPLYPYTLAAVYAAFGHDPMIVRWVQALAGSLACVLLALGASRFVNPSAGFIAGLLLAIYPPAVFFDGLVQKASLDNLLMCGLLAVLGAYFVSGRPRLLAWAGLVLGLFALTRENALVFLAILAAWLPFHLAAQPWKARAKASGLLVAGAALVLVPVGLRNKIVGGDFLITTAQSGPNFYMGNHEGATGRYIPILPGRETYEYERADATAVAEGAAGHALTPAQVSSYWWSRSLSWIESHPGDWIALLGKKFLVTWNRAELPDSESLEIYADHSPVLALLSAVFGFGVLVALAAPGMVLAWRVSPRPVPLYLMLFGFSAAVAAFYVFARYRFPMVPILAIFAGTTIAAAVEAVRSPRRPSLDPALAGAALLGLAAAALPPVVPAIGSRRLGYVNLAVGYKDGGRYDDAIAAFGKAIAIAPRVASPHRELALALEAAGRNAEAASELSTTIALDPTFAAAHDDLGALLIKSGDLDGAEAHLSEAFRLEPTRATAAANLGTLALARRRPADAAEWYGKASALAPADARYHYQLSIALADLDRPDEAERQLEATLRLDPANAAAHDDLGVLAARRGDLKAAEAHFREAYRLDPKRVSVLVNLGGVAMSEGRPQEAAGFYRRALAIDPGLDKARQALAQAEGQR